MKMDEANGSPNNSEPRKSRTPCCCCRGTHEHKCYMCFCGKCSPSKKKIPPGYAVKNRFHATPSPSQLQMNGDVKVSNEVQKIVTNEETDDQQAVDQLDSSNGNEGILEYFRKRSAVRSRPGVSKKPISPESATESGPMADEAEDGFSRAIPLNTIAGSNKRERPWKDRDPRGNHKLRNQNLTANRADDGPSKPLHLNPHTDDGASLPSSPPEEPKGNQVVMANTAEHASKPVLCNPHSGSGSNWDAWIEKHPRSNKSNSKWDAWTVKEPQSNGSTWDARTVKQPGNHNILISRAEDGPSKPVSLNPHANSGSSWASHTVKASRGEQEVKANRVADNPHCRSGSRWNAWTIKEPRGTTGGNPHTGAGSGWDAWTVKEPRGNHGAMAYKDGPSKPGSRSWNIVSGSSWPSWEETEARGKQEVTNKSASLNPCSGSRSSWDVWIGKRPRENQGVVDKRSKDGLLNPVPPKPQVTSSSSWPSWKENILQGNQEASTHRAEDETPKQVSQPLHAQSASSWDAWRVREQNGYNQACHSEKQAVEAGKQEVTANRAEDKSFIPDFSTKDTEPVSTKDSRGKQGVTGILNGSSRPISLNPQVGSSSQGPRFKVIAPSGRTGDSIHGKKPVQEGQRGASIPSNNARSFVKPANPIADTMIASSLKEKPPPIIGSGENNISLQGEPSNISFAEPASKPYPNRNIVWRGNFEILDFLPNKRIFERFVAHPAKNACSRAYKFACQIAGDMQFNIHPRYAFWPGIFQFDCPDANDIALYFYPDKRLERSAKHYANLMNILVDNDLILRSVMGRVELLVFSSTLLHVKSQKLYDGQYFMWGCFRQIERKKVA